MVKKPTGGHNVSSGADRVNVNVKSKMQQREKFFGKLKEALKSTIVRKTFEEIFASEILS